MDLVRNPHEPDTSDLMFILHPGMDGQHIKVAVRGFDIFAREFEPDWIFTALLVNRDHFDLYARTATAILVDSTTVRSSNPDLEVKMVDEDSVRHFFERLDELIIVHISEWFDRAQRLHTTLSSIVLDQLGGEIGMSFNLFDERIVDEINKRATRLANIVTSANRAGVREAVINGLREGLDQRKITAAIRAVHDEGLFRNGVRILNPEQRAMLIARTETTAMTNGVSLTGMKISEAEQNLGYRKVWVTVGDERVRPAHLDEEGPFPDGIPLGDSFPVTGLEHPEEPNCRCTLMYINVPTRFDQL